MRKHLKKVSLLFLPVFACGMMLSCTPEQVASAKNAMVQADFYVDMAEALVKVATTQYVSKPEVQKALIATSQALSTVKAAMKAVNAGLDNDGSKLKAAVVALVVEVFALAKAIQDARAAAAATS